MKKIGFIGAGNMATAIIKGLMAQNDGKADFINVFDAVSYTHLTLPTNSRV